jgi:sterol desaturase/sphingolipid hydroxylase (fatty acid hydroxylase superfamily)
MKAKLLFTCFGIVVASVVSFTGQPIVTQAVPVTRTVTAHRTPMIMISARSDGEQTRPSPRHSSLPRKKKTQIAAYSLPVSHPNLSPRSRARTLANMAVSKIHNADAIMKWRIAAASFLSFLVIFRPLLDTGLVRLWFHLQGSSGMLARCFRHDHWEWMLAVSAFFVWIHGFGLADHLVLKAAEKGRVHPLRKYRLQDRYQALKFRRQQLKRLNRDELVDLNAQPPIITKQSEWNLKAWIFELPLYVVPLFLWDYFIPRRAAKIATWGAPTTLQICRDVSCGLLLYDAFFFCGHVLMHKLPFLFHFVHKKHHINTECRAAEIVRLSFVEEVLEVGMSIAALNYLRAHPISRSIYNIIITFLLTELHCGFDFPWTPQNVVPFGLATGSRRHHYHHRIGKHYYQKFFCHVDRLLGFYQKDDGSLNGDSVQKFKNVPSSWTRGKE